MITLDTCAIIWNALEPRRLTKNAQKALADADQADGLIFCEISLWEIAMLMKKGRLDPGTNYREFIELVLQSEKYFLRGITAEIAELSVNLPEIINFDPADRIISATSVAYNAPLITADKNLRKAKILKTIW